MIFLRLILAIIVPTIIGAGVLALILRNPKSSIPNYPSTQLPKHPIPNLILSFALGMGLTTFLMFWWGFIGLSLLTFVIILTILAGILLIIFIRQVWQGGTLKSRLTKPFLQVRPVKILELILILIILIEIFFVFSAAMLRPAINFDALAIWAWKAKVFFLQPDIAFNPSAELSSRNLINQLPTAPNFQLRAGPDRHKEPETIQPPKNLEAAQREIVPSEARSIWFLGGGSHQNYPLHVPLLMTWTYTWLGQVDDILVNLIFAFYWLGLIAFIYFSLRSLRRSNPRSPPRGRLSALIFTSFLATIPLLIYHGFNAYADLILTFYFTLAAIFLFKYLRRKSSKSPNSPNVRRWESTHLVLAGIFAGLTAWVKNEGLMLVGVLLIVLLIYLFWESVSWRKRNRIKHCLRFIICALIFILPWVIFKKYFGLGYSNISSGAVSFGGFHPEIFPKILAQIFLLHSFHLWPGVFILLLIISWRKLLIKANFCLFLVILGTLAGYLIIYLFTPAYTFVLDATSTSRNFLTIIPLSIFLAGLLMGDDIDNPVVPF